MENKRIISTFFIITLVVLSLGLTTSTALGASTYTAQDVASHASTSDCWVIYEDRVFDLTEYLTIHNTQYYNINSWCGTDMTTAYDTKDGQGQPHTKRADTIFDNYYIGELALTQDLTPTTDNTTATVNTAPVTKNPYNLAVPLVLTSILYWAPSFYVKSKREKNPKLWPKFNLVWNTIMIICLIPSVVFGIFLVLRYSFPDLNNIDFNFMWWHVEGSIVFSVLTVSHLLNRLTTYFAQCRLLKN